VTSLNLAVHDQAYFRELLVSNRANGHRDLIASVDLATYRRLPWEKNVPFFLCRFTVPETGKYLDVDPRGVIADVVGRAGKQGWKCLAGAEFEVSHHA
jgi:glutamine synthetase